VWANRVEDWLAGWQGGLEIHLYGEGKGLPGQNYFPVIPVKTGIQKSSRLPLFLGTFLGFPPSLE